MEAIKDCKSGGTQPAKSATVFNIAKALFDGNLSFDMPSIGQILSCADSNRITAAHYVAIYGSDFNRVMLLEHEELLGVQTKDGIYVAHTMAVFSSNQVRQLISYHTAFLDLAMRDGTTVKQLLDKCADRKIVPCSTIPVPFENEKALSKLLIRSILDNNVISASSGPHLHR